MDVLGTIKGWKKSRSEHRKEDYATGFWGARAHREPAPGIAAGRGMASDALVRPPTTRPGEPVRTTPMKIPTTKHLLIPDCQIHAGVPTDHLTALGNYIIDQKPDVIINIGDFADMPSLSTYDRGTRRAEGKTYQEDIDAASEAMEKLLEPIRAYNRHATLGHRARYKPRMVLTLGNHENRIDRHVNANADLYGKLGTGDLPYGDWEVHPFLGAVDIDGILYSHYFPRNAQGRITQSNRGAPNARLQVLREMQSCSSGHLQGVDFACHQTNDRRLYGIIAGSFYQHDEAYLTPQGTAYWRGVVVKHEVENGEYDPMFVSLRYLLANWR